MEVILSRRCHGTDRHRRLCPCSAKLPWGNFTPGVKLSTTCHTYGKLLPSHGQPALVHHGGPRLHLLHRPSSPYSRWELSTVPPRPTIYSNRVGMDPDPDLPLTLLYRSSCWSTPFPLLRSQLMLLPQLQV